MLARLFFRFLIVLSVLTLAGVTYFFLDNFRELRDREHRLADLQQLAEEEGPCAGLQEARRLLGKLDADEHYTLETARQAFASQVVGAGDKLGRKVLLSADKE